MRNYIVQAPAYNSPQQASPVQPVAPSPLAQAILAQSMQPQKLSTGGSTLASALPTMSDMMRWKSEWNKPAKGASGSADASQATSDAGSGDFWSKIADFLGIGGNGASAYGSGDPSGGSGRGPTYGMGYDPGTPPPVFNTDTITPS